MGEKVLSLRNITKTYPGVTALDDMSIDFHAGEVHALLGENGAGKSTMIKVIAGAIQPDAGTVEFQDGGPLTAVSPQLAKDHGVEVIYQEFNLIGCLTVAENICFGDHYGRFVNYKHMREVAQKTFDAFDVDIDPKDPVYSLPSSKQQIVEIAKAISRKARILIMDEPSAPLSVVEVEKMFEIVRHLRDQGVAIIYISHRMEELFEIADKVTVMRDGKYITTLNTADTNRRELVNYMVGRELKETFPKREPHAGKVALKVENLYGDDNSDVSFEVREGEILGLAGLIGAGRTEVARLIYGADKLHSGTITLDGKRLSVSSPRAAIASGIGMIPEDRKRHGALLGRSVRVNTTLAALPQLSRFGIVNRKLDRETTEHYVDALHIKTPGLEQAVGNLSGGNQQKVVIARTLAAKSKVLIFDEPTRGIDVGAKQEIYKLISDLAESGKAVILISSEMEELIGLSDRILVLHEGSVTGELQRDEFTQSAILELASGISEPERAA
ncbi:sugar ABC transporter ATP-binding protein [Demequina capsici]|uniref:Sugar ABC transporter ATP-binding protein n=1 Tax=Demequina capsici TaxID=3075620 RepID=A0AA96JCS3_9MICO|nr:sugar ABC transporter ATP-binding protein [Demequina sp. PMTSA13]WNM27226.1 sugar ABC transporter ATP-binding protein [Demequina sp. PMTSA13]